jgi:hypothetical protein
MQINGHEYSLAWARARTRSIETARGGCQKERARALTVYIAMFTDIERH